MDGALAMFRGFGIPADLIRKTGGSVESFGELADIHLRNIRSTCGLRPGMNVIEVGCGVGRDAISLTSAIGSEGTYLGIDIIPESIAWCRQHITPAFPNFRFMHYDVADHLHNPTGSMATADIRLDAADDSVDLIVLQSVFTHLFEADIVHYLHEFCRVLRPQGRVYATIFVVSEAVRQSARASDLTPYSLRFDYEFDRGCFVNNVAVPAGAVGYRLDAVHRMIDQTGLMPAMPIQRGAWSGAFSNTMDGQDVLILKKQASAADPGEVLAFKEECIASMSVALDAVEPLRRTPLMPLVGLRWLHYRISRKLAKVFRAYAQRQIL